MEMKVEELADWKDGARRLLDREIERLQERQEQLQDYSRWMDATDELIVENERLRNELRKALADAEWARQQLQEKKEVRKALEMKLSELNKLSAGVARKSAIDSILKVVRSYLNTSKRKTLAKREAAKTVITELFAAAKVMLPEDIMDTLDHLDDEQVASSAQRKTSSHKPSSCHISSRCSRMQVLLSSHRANATGSETS